MKNTMNEVYANWPTEPEVYTLALVSLRDILKEIIGLSGDLFERQRLLGSASSVYWTSTELVWRGLKFFGDPSPQARFMPFESWHYRIPEIKSASIHDLNECKLPWDNHGSTDAARLAKAVIIPTFFPSYSTDQTLKTDPIWWYPYSGSAAKGFICPPIWILKTMYLLTSNIVFTLPSALQYSAWYDVITTGNVCINLQTLLTGTVTSGSNSYQGPFINYSYSGNNLSSGSSLHGQILLSSNYAALFEQIANFYDRVKVLADFSELFWNCIHEITMKAEGIPFGDIATLTRKTLIMRLYNSRTVGRDRENHLIDYLPNRTKLLYDEILNFPSVNSYTDDF